jgi:MerR family transcriptional regulator/heat shock protein HspR
MDDRSASFYTVGQVADMLGVQPAYLRRLEAEGLLHPARSDGNQRRYSRDEITLIERVTSLVAEGLTLAGIRRLLALEEEVDDLRRQLDEERARGQ